MSDRVVKGRDARRILNEMRNGTPDTPKRVETIRRADEVYQRNQERLETHRDVWRIVQYAKERGKSITELYMEYRMMIDLDTDQG